MKKINILYLIINVCLSQLFIQCCADDNKEPREQTKIESDEVSMLKNFLSKTLGMNSKDIVYNSKTNTFIIDKDVLMPLEDARNHYNKSNSEVTNKTDQRGGRFQMTPEIAGSVRVYVSPEVSSGWRIAINQAINKWNTINSSIAITLANDLSSSNVNINASNLGVGSIGYSSLPSYDQQPGRVITINTYYNSISAATKITVMTHEFGHAFGLNHTNQEEGPLLPCTPASDIYSVMHSIAENWIDGFSYYDNVAISTLYPVAAGTKKLYRYKKNKSYFYSTDACEIIPNKDDYVFDGDAGYLYSSEVSGTVPLYRVTYGPSKEHRLNKNRESTEDVIIGYINPTQQSGTLPLYSQGIYELRSGENPSYMYHYRYSTINPDAITKTIIGYVITK